MLARNPKSSQGAEQRKEQRRIRKRKALREHRARAKKGLAVYLVAVDGAVIDLLVPNYLTDDQTTDKALVNRGLSEFLWDLAHGQK
jgi:hypothetical protein